jgi:hypothetical protein
MGEKAKGVKESALSRPSGPLEVTIAVGRLVTPQIFAKVRRDRTESNYVSDEQQ